MKRIAALGVLCLASLSAASTELPYIPHSSLAALDGSNVIRLNEVTFPVFYQTHNAPGTPLHLTRYFDEFSYQVMPAAYREATIKFKDSDEFGRAEAAEQLRSFFDRLGNWSSNAEHVLIPVRRSLGEYDFQAKAFPMRLFTNGNMRLGDGRLAPSYCAGAMYHVTEAERRYEKHEPCILFRGSAEDPSNVFPAMPVPDLELAKELKANGLYEYFILAKPYHKSTLVYDLRVKHVLLAEPVGLYVFKPTGEYVTSIKSLAVQPSTSTFVNGLPSDSQFAFTSQKTSSGKTAKTRKRGNKLARVQETGLTAPASAQKKAPTTTVVIE